MAVATIMVAAGGRAVFAFASSHGTPPWLLVTLVLARGEPEDEFVKEEGWQQPLRRAHQPGERGDVVARFRPRRFDGVDEFLYHRFRRQGERQWFVALQAVDHRQIAVFVAAVVEVNPVLELLVGVAAKMAFDGAGLYQADVNAAAGKLQAQHVAPAFEREFGGGIGAAKAHRGEAEDGAVIDDAAVSLRAHDGQDAHGEVVPAEQAGIELVGQRVAREVFQRGGDGKGAVVKECVEGAAGLFEHPVERHADAVGFGEVKLDGIESFALQALHVGGVARAGKDLPAACLQEMGGTVADAAGTAGDKDAFFHDCLGWFGSALCRSN